MKKILSMMLLVMVLLLLPQGKLSAYAELGPDSSYYPITEGIYTYTLWKGEVTLKKCSIRFDSSIKELILPDTMGGYPVTKIGGLFFENPVDLDKIVLPKYLKTIERNAFSNRIIGSVVFPDGLETIEGNAFAGTSIKEIILPDSVTYIGSGAFQDCEAEKIVLPKGLTILEAGSFSYNNITEIEIPEKVTAIMKGALKSNKNLKTIKIHKNISIIEEENFKDCESLEYFDIDVGNAYFSSSDGSLIEKKTKTLLFYPRKSTNKRYEIPYGIKTISAFAFEKNEFLEELVIPNSVQTIGDNAFYGMKQLKTVFLGDGLTEIGKDLFKFCNKLEYVSLGKGISVLEEGMFSNCMSLKHVMIPKSVKIIKTTAFSGSGLVSLTVGENVETIENGAFEYCDYLETVNFGDNVTEISGGWQAVKKMIIPKSVKKIGGSYSLSLEIYYKGRMEEWQEINISQYAGLSRATIYYDYTGENERVKATSVACGSNQEQTEVTVKFESVSWPGIAFVCVYDEQGMMLQSAFGQLKEKDTEVQVVLPGEIPAGSKVKVYFWENAFSMSPCGIPVETTVS